MGDEEGASCLHLGAMSGDIQVCKLLVRYRVDLGAMDDDGMTAIDMVNKDGLTREALKEWYALLQVPGVCCPDDAQSKTADIGTEAQRPAPNNKDGSWKVSGNV